MFNTLSGLNYPKCPTSVYSNPIKLLNNHTSLNQADNNQPAIFACYQPNFTAREMSDEEFSLKLENIATRLIQRGLPEDIIKELVYESNISKENLPLAEVLLFDRTIKKLGLNMPKTLLYTDENNVDFAITLCKDSKYPRREIPDTLAFIDKSNTRLANKLLSLGILHKNGLYTTLPQFTEDANCAIGNICANSLRAYEDFPKEILNACSQYLNKTDYDFLKKLYEDPNLSRKEALHIFEELSTPGLEVLKYMYESEKKDAFSIERTLHTIKTYSDYFSKENIPELISGVNHQKDLVLNDKEKYIATYNRPQGLYMPVRISGEFTELFGAKYGELMLLASVLDKESLDVLFRKRLPEVNNKLSELRQLGFSKLELLNKCVTCTDINNKKLSPQDKFDLIDILYGCNAGDIDICEIKEQVKTGKLNLPLIKKQMLREILLKAIPNGKKLIFNLPDDKLKQWDAQYMPQLSLELSNISEETKILKDTIFAAVKGNFKDYIQDPRNIYGEHNLNTAKRFKMFGCNYEKWLNPPKSAEVKFLSTDKNAEQLSQISDQLIEDIETLRGINPAAKKYIDNQFPKFTKDGKFNIPKSYREDKEKLFYLISHLISDLPKVWKHADKNLKSNNEAKQIQAGHTLTILDHLYQRIDDLSKVSNEKITKQLNYTIKMWDRIPEKDLFQGNYSTCCIGMGKANSKFVPIYLTNTAFNMIEIVDNKSRKVIGNALCYFVVGENLKPKFVIDNIEINNSQKPSQSAGKELRNALVQYAKNISKEITNKENTEIILGKSYNDLPASDLTEQSERLGFIGDISNEQIYLDLYGGNIRSDNLYNIREFYQLS